MSFGGNTQPRRRVKQKPSPWRCHCHRHVAGLKELNGYQPIKLRDNPYYLSRCPFCKEERP